MSYISYIHAHMYGKFQRWLFLAPKKLKETCNSFSRRGGKLCFIVCGASHSSSGGGDAFIAPWPGDFARTHVWLAHAEGNFSFWHTDGGFVHYITCM
jgi:hypothetical protein